tara:strand:- start:786 stop:950 length:165 start_codon:yes stop_codon:yes gene_type:complete
MDSDIGFGIACVCLFIALVTMIIYFGGCETTEEDIGLTTRSSESTLVENPAHNV